MIKNKHLNFFQHHQNVKKPKSKTLHSLISKKELKNIFKVNNLKKINKKVKKQNVKEEDFTQSHHSR